MALQRKTEFRAVDHALLMGEGRDKIRWQNAEATEMALGAAQDAASKAYTRRMGRITRMGLWLSVLPSTANGTELGAQEWRDSLFMRYGIEPPNLPDHCNRCGAAFSICHTLDCKKGGLITEIQNEIRDGVADLAITPPRPRTCVKTPI